MRLRIAIGPNQTVTDGLDSFENNCPRQLFSMAVSEQVVRAGLVAFDGHLGGENSRRITTSGGIREMKVIGAFVLVIAFADVERF
jgi:hypothetical protein